MITVFYSLVVNTGFIAELLLISVNAFYLSKKFFLITMCNSFPPTGHDTITQLNDLGNSNYLFGMIPLIRQQHQEKEDIGNNCFRLPENKTRNLSAKFELHSFVQYNSSFYTQGLFEGYVVLVSYNISIIFVPCSVQCDFFPRDFFQALTITVTNIIT